MFSNETWTTLQSSLLCLRVARKSQSYRIETRTQSEGDSEIDMLNSIFPITASRDMYWMFIDIWCVEICIYSANKCRWKTGGCSPKTKRILENIYALLMYAQEWEWRKIFKLKQNENKRNVYVMISIESFRFRIKWKEIFHVKARTMRSHFKWWKHWSGTYFVRILKTFENICGNWSNSADTHCFFFVFWKV